MDNNTQDGIVTTAEARTLTSNGNMDNETITASPLMTAETPPKHKSQFAQQKERDEVVHKIQHSVV